MQEATTSSIISKYGEEERRRTRAKDTSMAREDSLGRPQMNAVAPVAGRFISAVRRRILVVRIAESIAISTAVASTAGLLVLPILWWRGQSALPLAEVMLAAGSFFGLIRGISRRPSRFEAAIEADSQLDLHDLLGTVVLLDKQPSGLAWQTTVAAYADDRCKLLSPSAIIVNRIGLRAGLA